ncbi:MAG: nitrite/sulfite reductase [Myxococcota bacterium]|nr:nitrite/sulfite reductase [Myxococcota bacterium]
MYEYDEFDSNFVLQRAKQFGRQVLSRLAGNLSEDQFRPVRLMNGLYLQLHAYMLRINVPYGCLNSTQLRKLAHVTRVYDKGYGHLTTRQNMQLNWVKLSDMPEILLELASVEMHGIQSSGNCIRNITADEYAGVAAEELEDPRVYCEILRQWSSLHPEFSFLPRKFKIAVTGCEKDRAAVKAHDIGLRLHRDEAGESGFEVFVGGGLGRTPFIGKSIRAFLPPRHVLSYCEAILRVYNQLGRRDNKYKARIKILVHEMSAEEFTKRVEKEWAEIREGALELPEAEVERVRGFFAPPAYETLPDDNDDLDGHVEQDPAFAAWVRNQLAPHKQPGYAIVNVSCSPPGKPPGDISSDQMDGFADLADAYNFGEMRVTHNQNLVLTDVRKADLFSLWQKLVGLGLATSNHGLLSDTICCPGLDYCALATARSIPLAEKISERFADQARQEEIGEIYLNMSGCINACGHHHIGNIGIVGVDKKNTELYQLMLGGSAEEDASLGKILGPGFDEAGIVEAVETVIQTYLELRLEGEKFIDAYRRLGPDPFKDKLYNAPA